MQKHCIKSSSNIFFGYLLESPQRGDSNKCPKHMLYDEIRIKQCLSHILFYPLRILYNSKFFIMATVLGTNAVVATRVHCRRYRRTAKGLTRHADRKGPFLHGTRYLYLINNNALFSATNVVLNHFEDGLHSSVTYSCV